MVYFISGLGADERVFRFLDVSKVEHRFIKWNEPKRKESLPDYCLRLIEQIDPNQEIILVGVSFGGIIAQEISKIIDCKKVIIISSVKAKNEFSWQLKLVSKLQIHKIVPSWLLILSNKLTADYYFDTESKEESKLLQQIITDTELHFLVWAIDKIMNWDNQHYSEKLVHIHGTADKIFPIKNIRNSIEIPNAGHFMIVNRSTQIQALIFD